MSDNEQQQSSDNMAAYVSQGWERQLPELFFIAAILGLGKGGVPALATVATALTVLTAPTSIPGGLGYAVALQVPILTMIDVSAAWLHSRGLDWTAIKILVPFSYIGMALGQWIDHYISDRAARLLVGLILLLILGMQLANDRSEKRRKLSEEVLTVLQEEDNNDDDDDAHHLLSLSERGQTESASTAEASSKEGPPAALAFGSASSMKRKKIVAWGAFVGVIGGAATMLTNSMGPLLNVYLLSVVQLSPFAYVGTRAMFFCIINLGKIPLRFSSGTLGLSMLPLASFLGLVSVLGVVLAKPIMLWLNPKTFVKLELAVVAFAGLRLCWMGLRG